MKNIKSEENNLTRRDVIRPSCLLLILILLFDSFISDRIVTIKIGAFYGACTVGLFDYISMLIKEKVRNLILSGLGFLFDSVLCFR